MTDEKPLTFAKLREENVGRCAESFHEPVKGYPADRWLVACTEELGEIARIVKRYGDGKLTSIAATESLASELPDLITYLDLLAASFDIDLTGAMRAKFAEVSERVGSTRRL